MERRPFIPPQLPRRRDRRRINDLLFPLDQLGDLRQCPARADLSPEAVLLLEDVHRAVGDLDRARLGDADDAALVADDPVAGGNRHVADLDRNVDLAESLGLAGRGRHDPRERGELERADGVDVADAAVDDDPRDLPLKARLARELAPHRRRARARVDDDHLAGLGDVDGLDGLGPVAGDRAHGDARPDHLRAQELGDHVGQVAGPVHRVGDVRRGDLLEDLPDLGFAAAALEVVARDRGARPHRLEDVARGLRGVGALRDRAPDDDDVRAGFHDFRRVFAVDAPRDRDRNRHVRTEELERGRGIAAPHLVVNGQVEADVVGAPLLALLRQIDLRVAVRSEEIDRDVDAVVLPRVDALEDGRVRPRADDRRAVGARLGGRFKLRAARVEGLEVRDEVGLGELAAQGADRVEALALHERRAGFDPLDAALDRLARRLQGPRELEEVEGELENGFHGGTILADSRFSILDSRFLADARPRFV